MGTRAFHFVLSVCCITVLSFSLAGQSCGQSLGLYPFEEANSDYDLLSNLEEILLAPTLTGLTPMAIS